MKKLLFFLIACCFSFIAQAQVAAITGPTDVCEGSSITLSDATPGGVWTSGTTTVAIVGTGSGVVTGIAAGTTTITYSVGSFGASFYTITVNPLPANFIPFGTPFRFEVCEGGTITVTDATPGGSWSSSTTTIATIGSSTGVITGIAPGTSTISYTLPTGCFVTATLTVNPNPGIITGNTTICNGFTSTLSNGTPGGTWSSSMISVADVGSSNGIVTGMSPGTATITYTLGTGCYATTTVTVNVQPAPITIGSVFFMCLGSSLTLSDPTPGGSWSSQNTGVATIGSSSGVVTAVGLGMSNITYMMPTGCYVTTPVFVNPNPGPITGNVPVCVGSTMTLSNGTPGGTWSSANTAIADVGSTSGVVTGYSAGTTTITYMLSTGCYDVVTVTVNPVPDRITGPKIVCVGSSITLSSPTSGGTWSSSNTSLATVGSTTGVVTGISPGVVAITYTLTATGCYTVYFVAVVANPAPITGVMGTCVGNSTTLSDATPGGTWSSSNTGVATVSGSGVVTGISLGTATITYTVNTCYVTTTVTISPLPSPILGPNVVCVGNTILLTNATPGGTWSSSNPSIATIGSTTGVVTGINPGGVTITYTLPSGCAVTYFIKVIPSPTPIIGPSTNMACVGSTIALTDATPGGTWSSSNTTIATVGSSTGVVTGVAPGVVNITYTLSVGCWVTHTLTIVPLPMPITGVLSMCVGNTTTLSNGTSGGTWSSGNTSVATITGTGIVTGVSAGTSIITYTAPSGCFVLATVTVNPLPAIILGPSSVCIGNTIVLTCATPGGTWSSSNTTIATVGSSTGVVTGVSGPSFAVITYTLATGCYVTKVVKTTASPAPITGILLICVGNTSTLNSATPGGTWTSSTPAVATVGFTSGVVTGNSAGTSTITYTAPSGCYVITTVTVTPSPTPIIGANTMCAGSTITLSDATPGGTWSSSNTAVATVGSSTGVVTGLTTGFTIITYMMPSGCYVTAAVKVTAPPVAITGVATVCQGMTTVLANATPGGVWSSSNTAIGTVTGTGVVTGVAPGTVTISYTIPPGCSSVMVVTVTPTPAPITGPNVVCATLTIALSDATPGGVWSSSNPAVATVSGTGVVTGIVTGSVFITYTMPSGCFVVYAVKVAPPCTVMVNEVTAGTAASVYPNPANDELIISADVRTFSRFTITDAMGREVMHNSITAEQTTVNIKHLAPGMYYISLKGDSDMQVLKVVKQ